jgi:uncharacterized membrane protein
MMAVMVYPLIMSFGLACSFVYTLVFPPSMIERIARLHDPDLDDSGVRYTRKVTVAWIVFFICNGALSMGTAIWGNLAIWTLYNGLISYLLIAAMFIGELVVRKYVRRQS